MSSAAWGPQSKFNSAVPGRLRGLWDIMQQFNGGKLFSSITSLSNMGHSVPSWQQNFAIPFKLFEEVKSNIDFICSELAIIGLPNSLVSAETLRAICEKEVEKRLDITGYGGDEMACFSPLTFGRFRNYAKDLVTRFKDELSAKLVFTIPYGNASYYQSQKPLFGDEVDSKFAQTSEDVAEAGKCIALGRYTASVFHLMRAMEAAVKVLGVRLNVTVVDRNNVDLEWGKILSNLSAPIEAMPKGSVKENWSAALMLLVHVKQAWRNPTMHPKQTYTEEQAKEIFAATRSFKISLTALV
jgi:hypothetical protein